MTELSVDQQQVKDWLTVRTHYPEAVLKKELTYGKCEVFTIHDEKTGQPVGPSAFSEANAWRWAAERLKRANVVAG